MAPPAPKLFISYSWSSPDHEEWVITLARQLRESGVDVILDKWELREGNDSITFMEKMVTDPTISKVAVISDKTYAEKADGRAGGVGTETQIISKEVYERQDQEKFVAVLPERDVNGDPYLPTYYKGRIYIDLSESERYEENFEKLVRWIFNKPIHVKPAIGAAPSYLLEAETISLGTTPIHRRLLEALRNGKPNTLGTTNEFLRTFAENLDRFRMKVDSNSVDKFHELIAINIEQFGPSRTEFVLTIQALSQYGISKDTIHLVHRFFERAGQYMHRPQGVNTHHMFDFDNYKFIVHELYLYTVAILLRDEHFELVSELLSTPYYFGENWRGGVAEAVSYTEIREYMHSFQHRNDQLARQSARADLLKANAEKSSVDFRHIMQADFVLYVRSAIKSQSYTDWWPESCLYATHTYNPFEIFARSVSTKYFDRVKQVLAIDTKEEIQPLLDKLLEDRRNIPKWDWDALDVKVLTGFDRLCARP